VDPDFFMADRFASIDYRALVDWPARLAREWPLLERTFGPTPSHRLLDLGCGPGEHAALLASHGFDVVGIDASPSMLDTARANLRSPAVAFVLGDLAELDVLVDGTFGGAICLGNTLPSVRTADELSRLLAGLGRHLLDGGVFVAQLLNYDRIFATGQRHLPLTVRPAGEGTLVFVRLMEPIEEGDLYFSPIVLRYRPNADPAVTVEGSERVRVHGWTQAELDTFLRDAGFTAQYYGSVQGAPYSPRESTDLVIVATRQQRAGSSLEP
jgi:SAM-dependent methyltransferase